MKKILFILFIGLIPMISEAQYLRTDSLLNNIQITQPARKILVKGDTLFMHVQSGSYVVDNIANLTVNSRLVAINLYTRELINWAPFSGNANIRALLCTDDHLYVGGAFYGVAGYTYKNLVRFDLQTLELDTTWLPEPTNDVVELATNGDRLCAAGYFTTIGGISSPFYCQFDLQADTLMPAQIVFDTYVRALAYDHDTLYVGGGFSSANGNGRNRMAKINPDGTLNAWNPSITFEYTTSNSVNKILMTEEKIHVIAYSYYYYYSGSSATSNSRYKHGYISKGGGTYSQTLSVGGGYYSSYYYYSSYGDGQLEDMILDGDSIFICGRVQPNASSASAYGALYLHRQSFGVTNGTVLNYQPAMKVDGFIYSLARYEDLLIFGGFWSPGGGASNRNISAFNFSRPVPIWTGTGNWYTNASTNWSTGLVPAAIDSVVVKNGSVDLSDSTTVKGIFVKAGAQTNLEADGWLNINEDAHLHEAITLDGGTAVFKGDIHNADGLRVQVLGEAIETKATIDVAP